MRELPFELKIDNAALHNQAGSTPRLTKLTIDVICSGVLLFLSPSVGAQQQPESNPLRFDFAPIIGYRTSMNIPIEPHVTGTNPHVTVDSSPSYGASIGIRPHEDDLVEIRWTRQDSYVHSEDVNLQPPRQRVVLDQFHGDFSHEYVIENWASWARPFVMGSVGVTHISNSTNVSSTRFSFGLGGGVRFYVGQHLGFKVQAEWLPIFLDPHLAFICGPGCIVSVGGTISNQGEILLGPILRF